MPIGKSISLFLIDGTSDGVVACELFNWTGKGYKIPRSRLKELSNRDDLKRAGVYFLVGRDETESEAAYVGEAEEVFKRILQHQDKGFWTEALVFLSKERISTKLTSNTWNTLCTSQPLKRLDIKSSIVTHQANQQFRKQSELS